MRRVAGGAPAGSRVNRRPALDMRGPAVLSRAVNMYAAAPRNLLVHPRIGEKLEEFDPREVRRILVGRHEMRYEIQGSTVFALRRWHAGEER